MPEPAPPCLSLEPVGFDTCLSGSEFMKGERQAVADKYGEPAFRIRAQAQFLKDGDNRFLGARLLKARSKARRQAIGDCCRSAAQAVDLNSADSTAGRTREPIACRWLNEWLEDAERPGGHARAVSAMICRRQPERRQTEHGHKKTRGATAVPRERSDREGEERDQRAGEVWVSVERKLNRHPHEAGAGDEPPPVP